MNIIYLTWGETPRTHGVYGTQVIDQLSFIHSAMPESNIALVCAVPIINSGIVRDGLNWIRDLINIKRFMLPVSFNLIPIVAPQNFVNSSRHTFCLFHIFTWRFLKRLILKYNPQIIHCRSYHSAWAAIKCRERYRFKYKVIFDPRGLYPEEVSLKREKSGRIRIMHI